MLKQRFWLGFLGLVIGVVLAYVQPPIFTFPRKPTPAVATKPIAEKPTSQRIAEPDIQRPRTILSYTAPTSPKTPPAARLSRQPSAAIPAPVRRNPLIYPPIYKTPFMEPDILSDAEFNAAFSSFENEKLWSGGFASRLNDLGGGGNLLQYANTPAVPDNLPTVSINSLLGIGLGYRLFESQDMVFKGRFGGGLSQDYLHLPQEGRIPEVLFGFQFEHHLDQRNKIYGEMEFGRDVMDYTQKRVQTKAAWELLLNEENNVSMRTSIQKNTKSTVDGEETINLNYTLDLIWKF